MALVCPIILISIGGTFLLFSAILGLGGYPFIIKSTFDTALSFMPDNEKMEVWIEIPIPIHITATTFNMSAIPVNEDSENNAGLINEIFKEPPNDILGVGQGSFKIEMEAWADDGGGEDYEEEEASEAASEAEEKKEEIEEQAPPSPKLVPFIWIQESAAIDSVQRYAMVLAKWNLNAWIVVGYMLMIFPLIMVPIGLFLMKNQKPSNIVSDFIEKRGRIWQ